MAGDEFRVFQDDREARDLADQRALKARIEEQNRVKHVTLENLFATMEDAEVKELNLIIKADVQGSIEALQDSLDKMDQSEVRINTIHSAVGAITETDVILADASNAIIIGFGVRPEAKARVAAERDGVEIRSYSVIYKAIEEINAARIGMLEANLIGFSGDLYGNDAEVVFVRYLRPPQKFGSRDALTSAVLANIEWTRKNLGNLGAGGIR